MLEAEAFDEENSKHCAESAQGRGLCDMVRTVMTGLGTKCCWNTDEPTVTSYARLKIQGMLVAQVVWLIFFLLSFHLELECLLCTTVYSKCITCFFALEQAPLTIEQPCWILNIILFQKCSTPSTIK